MYILTKGYCDYTTYNNTYCRWHTFFLFKTNLDSMLISKRWWSFSCLNIQTAVDDDEISQSLTLKTDSNCLFDESDVISVHAFINHKLDYCNSLLHGLPDLQLQRIQITQNNTARILITSKRNSHIILWFANICISSRNYIYNISNN